MKIRVQLRRAAAVLLAAALLMAAAPAALAWQRYGDYHECLALATDGTRWGYVNGAGSLVIPLRFTEAEPFFLGVAKVSVGSKEGLLRQDGTYLLTPVYDELKELGSGLYAGKRNGTWALLWISELSEGSAAEGGDAHALYDGASSIGWEETVVIVTPQPEAVATTPPEDETSPRPESVPTVQPESVPTAQPESETSPRPDGGGTEGQTPAPEISPTPTPAPTPTPVTEVRNELVLRWADGSEVRMDQAGLLRLLEERQVPGWTFPLDTGRRASFGDVSGRDWFSPWVDIAYSVGLMEGRGGNNFQPWENLGVCEALKLAAVMDSRGAGREVPEMTQGVWYQAYLDYCIEYGIVKEGEFEDLLRPITRAELALLISRTSLYDQCADINDPDVIRWSVPDVKVGDYAAQAIFGLYAKGVLTGYTSSMTFMPNAPIVRAEVAALAGRMVRPEQRVKLQLSRTTYRSVPAAEPAEK